MSFVSWLSKISFFQTCILLFNKFHDLTYISHQYLFLQVNSADFSPLLTPSARTPLFSARNLCKEFFHVYPIIMIVPQPCNLSSFERMLLRDWDIFSVACQCASTITQKTGEILPPVFVLPISLSSVILFVTEISSQAGISVFI